MKKSIAFLICLLTLIACNDNHSIQQQDNGENSWKQDNLKGKVKSLQEFKAVVTDPVLITNEEAIIHMKKEYNREGYITNIETFDGFGKSKNSIKNIYNENKRLTESINQSQSFPFKLVQTNEYNEKGQNILMNVVIDDSLNSSIVMEYDDQGNILIQKNIQNGDTTFIRFEYVYDEHNNVSRKEEIAGNNHRVNEMEYDKKGNLTETTYEDNFWERKTTYEYDNHNRLIKTLSYMNGNIEFEFIFDENQNRILEKRYTGSNLTSQNKYEYIFDKQGNWIQRTTYVNEVHSGSDEYVPVYVETRKIEYYD